MLKKFKGFTLIELLVVISIIGILATLMIANLNSARSRARDAERKSDIKNISTALRLYYNDYNLYPTTNYLVFGSAFTNANGTTTYMATVPNDPTPGQTYFYNQTNSGDGFKLWACLENSSDPQGTATGTCGSGMAFQIVQ